MELEQVINSLPDKIAESVSIIRIAAKGIAIIRERTLGGKFLTGTGAGQKIRAGVEQYSTKAMPIPYGLYMALMGEKPPEGAKIFRNKSGAVMVIFTGGYKRLRELSKKPNEHVYMSWTGRMLRNLNIIRSEKTIAEIGFNDAETERIAGYHNKSGAGKNKVLHPFLGFTAEDETQLVGMAEQEINNLLKSI
ncbi:MAG: hypothetical protein PHN44_04210 [Candidatus Marinimicrobia bacterium]|jgi:hypothetical protein|nr:hypothetical protein [Candidatus Neomarinimicrobiota bacterium]MDD5539510.1 hypothetical protein [Candidatus Neomarinimicrobiota bacterium]